MSRSPFLRTLPSMTNSMNSGSYSPLDERLLAERKLLLGTPIDSYSAQLVIAKLLYLNQQDASAPVTLYINSPGGSITASLAIVDTILGLKMSVRTFALSQCHGTALLILAVGTRGQRQAAPDALLSLEPTELRSPDPDGRASYFLHKLKDRMAHILSIHTRLTREEVLEALTRGKLFTAQEALAVQLIDSITSANVFGPHST